MPLPSYLLRRGAIYYWRRRLPRAGDDDRKARHLLLSLATSDLARARLLAAHLNVVAEEIFGNAAMLNAQQINDVFRNVLQTHVDKLDRVVATESVAADFDWRDSVRIDERWHWVYRLLGMRGSNTEVDENAAALMRTAEYSEEDIFAVALLLQQLRRQKMVPTPSSKLQALLAAVGADPTDANIGAAQQVYFRALSEASAINAQRQREGRPEDQARAKAILMQEAARVMERPADDGSPTAPAPAPQNSLAQTQVVVSTPALRPSAVEDHPVWHAGEKLIAHNKKNNIWRDKGQKQAGQTHRMLVLLLLEREVYSIEALQQADFSAYRDLLGELAKSYGKSEKDHTRTLDELRGIGKSKPPHLRGLLAGTVNRHMSALATLVGSMRDRGLPVKTDIDPGRLRVKKVERSRVLTQPANLKRVNIMMHLPPLTGCASAENPFVSGEHAFHCANYFVPMLMHYQGGRREELCGFRVAEIILDAPIPYFELVRNAYRDLKTLASDRAFPIHPELLRLGFDLYVKAIDELGYDLLFPELRWGDSKMPLGDRFYKNFKTGLRLIRQTEIDDKPLEPGETKSGKRNRTEQPFKFRQIRKAFGAQLKKKGIHSEERADLMGHTGRNVNEEIYVDPIELERALELMKEIPNVTSHLEPRPVNLLPWVRDNLPPPDARGRERRKRLKSG